MKTIIIAILMYLFYCPSMIAKTNKDTLSFPKNSTYIEFFGTGGNLSINYDRIMFSKKQMKISLKYGASYNWDKERPIHSLQVNLLQSMNQKNIWLETGIGLTESFGTYTLISSSMGFRFQNPESHLFFKAYMFLPVLCKIKNAPSSLLTTPFTKYYFDSEDYFDPEDINFKIMSLLSISIGITF